MIIGETAQKEGSVRSVSWCSRRKTAKTCSRFWIGANATCPAGARVRVAHPSQSAGQRLAKGGCQEMAMTDCLAWVVLSRFTSLRALRFVLRNMPGCHHSWWSCPCAKGATIVQDRGRTSIGFQSAPPAKGATALPWNLYGSKGRTECFANPEIFRREDGRVPGFLISKNGSSRPNGCREPRGDFQITWGSRSGWLIALMTLRK